jgi:hypothetical protein
MQGNSNIKNSNKLYKYVAKALWCWLRKRKAEDRNNNLNRFACVKLRREQ